MTVWLRHLPGATSSHEPKSVGAACWRWVVAAALALILGACTTLAVSDFDKESVDRSTEISKAVLKFYQDLTALEPGKRTAAMAGALGAKQGDIDTQMRLHLMREQARSKNADSIDIASNMLASWQKFSASHLSSDNTALNSAVLNIERAEMERHLRAAFKAEEAKKLVSGGAK
jgi:hypothetical protein